MGAIDTTYTFTATDTITSTKMNNIIDQTTFTSDAVFDTTLAVASGKLKVNAQGITSNELASNAVTNAKLSTLTGEIGAEWQSYTPVFTLGGGTSSNGNAVITGRYIKIGKTIHFRISYVLGTTTAYTGLTFIQASFPVLAHPYYVPNHPIGGISYHNGVNVAPGVAIMIDNNKMQLYSMGAAGSTNYNTFYSNVIVSGAGSIPFNFSPNSNNQILISGTYEAA